MMVPSSLTQSHPLVVAFHSYYLLCFYKKEIFKCILIIVIIIIQYLLQQAFPNIASPSKLLSILHPPSAVFRWWQLLLWL